MVISIVVFIVTRLAPGDPALMLLGPTATPSALEQARADLGLDQPLYMQYVNFLRAAFHGDLGRSFMTKQPVIEALKSALPPTFELALAAFGLSVLIGIPLGIVSAVKRGGLVDNLIRILSVAWFSIPVFWSGLMLILLFSVYLRWFPPFGHGTPMHLVLPAFSLALVSIGMLTRMTRSSVLEVLDEDYVRTARAKGLVERAVIFRHVLKNAMLPVVTVLGLQFGTLLSGAVLTESVFARPGLGRLLVDAIFARDYPVIRVGILTVALIVILVNLLTDLTYLVLDPRVQYE